MDKIRDIDIFCIIIFLMIIRFFASGKWFGCVVIAGLLVAIFDLIIKLYKSNLQIVVKQQKVRYGICFILLNILFLLGCILIAVNVIFEIQWLNEAIFLDEMTLLTLLLTLSQNLILESINKIIRG